MSDYIFSDPQPAEVPAWMLLENQVVKELRDKLSAGQPEESKKVEDCVQFGLDTVQNWLKELLLYSEAIEQHYQGMRQRLEELCESLEKDAWELLCTKMSDSGEADSVGESVARLIREALDGKS